MRYCGVWNILCFHRLPFGCMYVPIGIICERTNYVAYIIWLVLGGFRKFLFIYCCSFRCVYMRLFIFIVQTVYFCFGVFTLTQNAYTIRIDMSSRGVRFLFVMMAPAYKKFIWSINVRKTANFFRNLLLTAQEWYRENLNHWDHKVFSN